MLETIAVRAAGARVAGVALVSNPAAGTTDAPVDHLAVIDAVHASAARTGALLVRLVEPRCRRARPRDPLLVVHHTPSPSLHELLVAVVEGAGTDEIEAEVEVVRRPAAHRGRRGRAGLRRHRARHAGEHRDDVGRAQALLRPDLLPVPRRDRRAPVRALRARRVGRRPAPSATSCGSPARSAGSRSPRSARVHRRDRERRARGGVGARRHGGAPRRSERTGSSAPRSSEPPVTLREAGMHDDPGRCAGHDIEGRAVPPLRRPRGPRARRP